MHTGYNKTIGRHKGGAGKIGDQATEECYLEEGEHDPVFF